MARPTVKKLKVGPHTYEVHESDLPDFLEADPDNHQGLFGCHWPASQRIYILRTLESGERVSQSRMDEVLLHEVLHAVWSHSVVHDGFSEEVVVKGLASALMDVLRSNPWFAKRVLGAPEERRVRPASPGQLGVV